MFPTSTDLVEVIIFSLHHVIFRITYYQNLQKLQNSDISETLGTIHILRHHILGIFGPPSPPTSACF